MARIRRIRFGKTGDGIGPAEALQLSIDRPELMELAAKHATRDNGETDSEWMNRLVAFLADAERQKLIRTLPPKVPSGNILEALEAAGGNKREAMRILQRQGFKIGYRQVLERSKEFAKK